MALHYGSLNWKLSQLEVGERIFIETTEGGYQNIQRQVSVKKVRPAIEMVGMEFSTRVYTAVSNSKVGDVCILVAVERIK